MARLIGFRVLAALPTLLLVTVLTFGLVHLFPGSPADTVLGPTATEEERAAVERELGLDQPLAEQYVRWLGDAATGDLGASLVNGESVGNAIAERIPATLSLATVGLAVAVLLGVPAGIAAAIRPGGWVDRSLTLGSALALAVPAFWVAMVLARWAGAEAGWFPAIGYTSLLDDPLGWAHGLVLPGLALGAASAATLARQTRGALIDVLQRDYVRTARANGLPVRRIIVVHALPNALAAVVTVLGFQATLILGASFVVETVFAISGLGELGVRSVLDQDLPMVQGFVLVSAIGVVVMNLAVDVSYGVLDPRVRPR